ncbi:MAG: hypothetical protein Q9162_006930 [Coniocarpon cinnabarinum]
MSSLSTPKDRETSLHQLEANINKIYMHVGGVFNNSTPSEGYRLAKTQSRLQTAVPSIIGNLNDALDTLEGDLIRARAVLTRDLRLLYDADSKNASVEQRPNGLRRETEQDAKVSFTKPDSAYEDTASTKASDVTLIDANQPPQPSVMAPGTAGAQEQKADESSKPKIALDTPVKAEQEQLQSTNVDSGNAISNETAQTLASRSGNFKQEQSMKPSTSTDKPESETIAETHRFEDRPTENAPEDMAKDEEAEPSPGNDFSSLLPGLDMYANDPSGDALSTMDQFNDVNNPNSFDMGDSADTTDALFGAPNDLNQDMGQFNDDFKFDDMIAFDAPTNGGDNGQGGAGQGGLDEFDDDFFNIGGS